MPDEKKIDEEWKKKAQEGRSQVEQSDDEPAEGQPKEQDNAEQESGEGQAGAPQAEFSVLVSSLATQALIGLGVLGHPISKKKELDLESAKFSIDLLQVLADKTKGNLSDLEARYIDTILHDLRMKFVEATK